MKEDFTNIDKKFLDRAWADMASRLDENMPTTEGVKKRKRPFGLFWMFFIGLLLGGGITFYMFKNAPNPTPISAFKIPMLDKHIHVNEEKPIASNTLSILPSKESPNTINTTPQKSNKATFSYREANQSLNVSVINQKSTNKFVKKSPKSPLEKMTLTTNSENSITENNLQRAAKEGHQTMPILLSAKEMEPLLVEANHDLPDLSKATEVKNKQFVFGLSAGSIFGKAWRGGYVAAEITKPISNRLAWTLAAGLSRQRLDDAVGSVPTNALTEQSNDEFYVEFSNGATGAQDPSTPIENSESNQKSTIIPTKLTLNYVHVNMGLSYRISPRWEANTGLMLASLLSSPSEYTNGGLFDVNRQLDESTLETNDIDPSVVENLSLKSIDVASTLGVSFYATKKIAIQGGYRFGFFDFRKNTNSKKHNRFFTLGLRYQFHPK